MTKTLTGITELSPTNNQIFATRMVARWDRKGPQVGDWIRLEDGTLTRMAYDWEDRIQRTETEMDGSFHLSENGAGSHSGSLSSDVIQKSDLVNTGEMKEGGFWFFSEGRQRTHNGVNVTVLLPIWKVVD